MDIVEAIRATTPSEPYITREAWACITPVPVSASVKIQPTDNPDGCIVLSWTGAHRGAPRWSPNKSDLLADDWITTR